MCVNKFTKPFSPFGMLNRNEHKLSQNMDKNQFKWVLCYSIASSFFVGETGALKNFEMSQKKRGKVISNYQGFDYKGDTASEAGCWGNFFNKKLLHKFSFCPTM